MGNRDNFGKCRSCGQQVIWIKTVAGKEYALQSAACHIQAGRRQGKDSHSEWRSVKRRAGRCRNAGRNRHRLHIAFCYLSECRKAQKEITESRYFL